MISCFFIVLCFFKKIVKVTKHIFCELIANNPCFALKKSGNVLVHERSILRMFLFGFKGFSSVWFQFSDFRRKSHQDGKNQECLNISFKKYVFQKQISRQNYGDHERHFVPTLAFISHLDQKLWYFENHLWHEMQVSYMNIFTREIYIYKWIPFASLHW